MSKKIPQIKRVTKNPLKTLKFFKFNNKKKQRQNSFEHTPLLDGNKFNFLNLYTQIIGLELFDLYTECVPYSFVI